MTTQPCDVPETPPPRSDKRSRHKIVLGLFGLGFGFLFVTIKRFLVGYEGPWGVKLALVLVPWILLGMLFRHFTRIYREDELEVLINRKALVFAFYTAFFGLVMLELFQAGGFVPRFAWTNERLILVLASLMTVGMIWSQRRYR